MARVLRRYSVEFSTRSWMKYASNGLCLFEFCSNYLRCPRAHVENDVFARATDYPDQEGRVKGGTVHMSCRGGCTGTALH